MVIDLVRLLLFPSLMAFAAVSDMMTMTISNRISLLLVAGFILLAAASGFGPQDYLQHAGAGAIVLAIGFFFFAMGWMGGGDAKMASAVALWFGFAHMVDFLLYASIFGGALTLLLLEFRRWPLPYPLAKQAWLLHLHHRDTGIPYGIALALGALIVYPNTIWMRLVDISRFAVG
jgi:prepilin peptidase CpaA